MSIFSDYLGRVSSNYKKILGPVFSSILNFHFSD